MYTHVFIGGTFDGLHKGHETVLTKACEEGKDVTIGLTSDQYVKTHKVGQNVQPFEARKKNLEQWLSTKGLNGKAVIIPIEDAYEPAASDFFDAIVVTPDNKSRGEEINSVRRERKLSSLALIEVALVPASDGMQISSTRIRKGEINPEGRLLLPEGLRALLRKPIGAIYANEAVKASLIAHKADVIATIGDFTTKVVQDSGIIPSLAVIDLQVNRKPFQPLEAFKFGDDTPIARVKSGPGFIARGAIGAIEEWGRLAGINRGRMLLALVIDGEDDLLTLPVIAHAPLGSVIYYGQPDQGIVEVIATQAQKQFAVDMLKQFTEEK